VKGKLVIARYGASFRGAKQAVAAMYGAAGVLIYDDPVEDGCALGTVMPNGPYRPSDGIQRGSSLYIWNYVGDPLTPGWAATEKAPRLPLDKAENLPQPGTAMMAPLGYGDVSSMLANLGGPQAPASWQGGLGLASCTSLPGVTPVPVYRVGPGPVKVHMQVHNENAIKPIKNWTVTIPGSKYPDQMVILGGHRDGWAYGTSDSISGAIPVMEMARGFSELLKQGWQPERTIVLAGWDAEEPALLGSTEWVEDYAQRLGKSAVAFVNMDNAGGGVRFGASAIPALDDFIYEAAKEVTEPRNGLSLYDDWVQRSQGNPRPRIGRLGGGSDYQPFLDHVGVASMSFGFSGTSGSYHSAYDDLWRMNLYGDPGYLHHATAAQIAGVLAMRLANADLLPFRYSQYAASVVSNLDRLSQLQVQLYGQVMVSFDREKAQAEAWGKAAADLEAKVDALIAANPSVSPKLAGEFAFINEKLIRQERNLTQAKGLPGRPWYRHMIYSTGILSGYTVETLPALEDMITAGDWAKVRNYAALLHNSLVTATNGAATAAK
ncbi:MAG: M28 family peptidase, partial [Nitrososphaerales archaeon]